MGIIFLWWVFLYLYLVYMSPCRQLSEMKENRGQEWNAGKGETPLVWGVCGYWHLSVPCVGSWLSRGDSVLLFVPCGPGSVRVCGSVSATLVCYVASVLVPVGRHR